jgi:lipopolysaccharide heptosyltransferase II
VTGSVLAIRPRALGDVVLVTPALRSLALGGAQVEVVTERRYAPLLEGLDFVRRVWPLDRTSSATVALIAALRRRRFERAVDFFGNPRTAAIAALCGARVTAGYELRGRRRAYRVRVPRELTLAGGRREHASATHVRLALAAGGVADGLEPRVAVGEAARAEAAEILATAGVPEPGRAVGLVAAGTWPTKTWPLSHAVVLARRLIATRHPVVAILGPGEARTGHDLEALAPGVAALPPCDVGVLAAVIERLAAVVGTDSGPRHLAAALGVPTFAWFGPTHPDTWNPPGEQHGFVRTELPCRACDRTQCPHWNCMPGLEPEGVSRRVIDHLARHGKASALGTAARA